MKKFSLNSLFSPLNLLLATFGVIVVAFAVNYFYYQDNSDRFYSAANLQLVDQNRLLVNFSIDKIDQVRFQKIAASLGLQGESRLEFLLDPLLTGQITERKMALDLRFLTSGVLFQTANFSDGKKIRGNNWLGVNLSPLTSWVYLQDGNVRAVLPDGLQKMVTKDSALALFPLDKQLNFAVIRPLSEDESLELLVDRVEKETTVLNEASKEAELEAKPVFSEGVVESQRFYTFTQKDNLPLVVGVVKDYLVISSDQDAFLEIVKVANGQVKNLTENDTFQKARGELSFSDNSAYLQLPTETKGWDFGKVKNIMDIEQTTFANLQSLVNRIDGIGVVYDSQERFQGVINLR